MPDEHMAELQESLEAAETALSERQRSAEELAEKMTTMKKEQTAMMLRLGLARRKQLKNHLPFLSSEHHDPSMCAHLEYSLAHIANWFFGDSLSACQAEARRLNEFEAFDVTMEAHGFIAGKSTNCAELRGLGMAPVTAKVSNVGMQTFITRMSEKASVMVNNLLLEKGEKSKALQHGDKITIGRCYVFRAYIDSTEYIPDNEQMHTPRERRTMYHTPDEMKQTVKKLIGEEQYKDTFLQHHAKQFLNTLRNLWIMTLKMRLF